MRKALFLGLLSISTPFAWGAHADAEFNAVPTPPSGAAAGSLTAEALPPATPTPCEARPLRERSFAVNSHEAVTSCLARPVERSPRMTKLMADREMYVGTPYTEEVARRLREKYDISVRTITDKDGKRIVIISGLSVSLSFLLRATAASAEEHPTSPTSETAA